MRFHVGKLKEVSLAANPSNVALSIPRVPINSVAFKPTANHQGEYVLLAAGGSAVSLWTLRVQAESEVPIETHTQTSIQVKVEPDATQTDESIKPTTNSARWLHASACGARVTAERLGFFSDHAPDYVIRVQWSASGDIWASADGKRVIVFAKKSPDDETSWQRLHCILEPTVQEIFDFAFVGQERLVIGGLGRASIRTLPDVRPDAIVLLPLEDGEFVKGIAARQLDIVTFLICLGTSHKCAKVYIYNVSDNSLTTLMTDRTLFTDGPSDHPGLRYVSIDPTGRLVAFAYGARKHDTFGALYDLWEMRRAMKLKESLATCDETKRDEIEKQIKEITTDAKYRVRGHQTRINCVAFSNQVKPLELRASDFVATSKAPGLLEEARSVFAQEVRKLDQICLANPRWPKYISYAQASIEGLLSIWRVFIPYESEQTLSGICLTATPHMLVDQTGLISSIDWSHDDALLVVGSDDGKLTCLYFEEDSRSSETADVSMRDITRIMEESMLVKDVAA